MNSATQLPEGAVIDGRYRVQRCLGAGGYGEVYQAEQLAMGRAVALKVMHARMAGDPTAIRRFRREAQQACHLKHPNTVIYYDFGADSDQGILYLAMELLQGESLADRLKRQGALSTAEALAILTQVCHSLHEAHELGLVHRDVKPGNVMLIERAGQRDIVKVIDFGISKATQQDDTETDELTASGTIIGSPSYMAPEQIRRGGAPLDRRTDVYALACMTYKLLTGLAPFRGASAIEIATQHLAVAPPPISALTRTPLPRGLDDFLLRALSKDPDERPADALAFAAQLAKAMRSPTAFPNSPPTEPMTSVIAADEIPTAPSAPTTAAVGWSPQHKRRVALLGLVTALGALFFVLAAGALYKSWSTRQRAADAPLAAADAPAAPAPADAPAPAPPADAPSPPADAPAPPAEAPKDPVAVAAATPELARTRITARKAEKADKPEKADATPPADDAPKAPGVKEAAPKAPDPAPDEVARDTKDTTPKATAGGKVDISLIVGASEGWVDRIAVPNGPTCERKGRLNFCKGSIKPGTYQVQIEKQGRKSSRTIQVTAEANQRFTL
jgi:hypothetical protein